MNASTQRNSSNASQGDSPEIIPPKPTPQDRVEVNVSELVMSARREIAMARVEGPINFRSAFGHARAARLLAYRAGAASLNGTRLPIGFEDSPTLTGAWRAGQSTRARPASCLSLVVG